MQPDPPKPATRLTQACTLRCESDHLSDFIVVSGPSSWDELIDSVLAGFVVNVFSWDQATHLRPYTFAPQLPPPSPLPPHDLCHWPFYKQASKGFTHRRKA